MASHGSMASRPHPRLSERHSILRNACCQSSNRSRDAYIPCTPGSIQTLYVAHSSLHRSLVRRWGEPHCLSSTYGCSDLCVNSAASPRSPEAGWSSICRTMRIGLGGFDFCSTHNIPLGCLRRQDGPPQTCSSLVEGTTDHHQLSSKAPCRRNR